jgi:hypothetical protein
MSRINSSKGQYAILFLFGCILFHMVGTWSIPLIDRDEPRFAEASREMIERGEYIVPHFNNQLRLDKPPLAYWAQVASYRIFGESDFAARFPSAVAAALVALAILAWGTRGSRVVGGDHFHAVTANFCPRQSRRRRYVAGPVYDNGLLGWLRANRESRIEKRKTKNKMVVRSLFVACARFPRKRTDRVDAVVNARRD